MIVPPSDPILTSPALSDNLGEVLSDEDSLGRCECFHMASKVTKVTFALTATTFFLACGRDWTVRNSHGGFFEYRTDASYTSTLSDPFPRQS